MILVSIYFLIFLFQFFTYVFRIYFFQFSFWSRIPILIFSISAFSFDIDFRFKGFKGYLKSVSSLGIYLFCISSYFWLVKMHRFYLHFNAFSGRKENLISTLRKSKLVRIEPYFFTELGITAVADLYIT